MKQLIKLFLTTILIVIISLSIDNHSFAAWSDDIDVDYYVIPKINEESIQKIQDATDAIWRTWWSVMATYRAKAQTLTKEEQINSWIMTRDTIMDYLIFVIKFLSQIWLVIWAGYIMFAGYKYMTSVLTWSSAEKSMIPNAITLVIIIIFSYAIMKTLTSIVWLS